MFLQPQILTPSTFLTPLSFSVSHSISSFLTSLQAIKSLESELHTLVKVQHPYLLRIYGVCEASVDELWIIMESATGKSLAYNLQNKVQKERAAEGEGERELCLGTFY